ncbi:hypothetical protein PF327_09260 [Sulfurovum sp. XTW-4]|uniref:Fibronectin type-III domain-containing protein n=1 Tax=Sulfurovum xiamenensis TaxID=3019066 RepID=A0ABT7QUG1_9BACT|nr:hypothetical protein [Sulfurovum xiamenensis]MDM5264382.1 hypothetical protein [Sulfurovum xiamenensis]
MFRLNNIKHNVLILSFATLLAGCGGGGTATTTDSTTTDLTTAPTEKVVKIDIIVTATEDSATIEWNPYGYTTKSVEYGTSNKYGSVVTVQEEGTVTLSNLQAATEYHYRTVSEDERGRLIVSSDNTFTTLASTQPIVTDPVPTEPIVTEPIITEPVPTEPIVTDPAPTETNTTEPTVTEPAPTNPIVTDPIVTEPAPTDPVVTEPAPVCQSGPAMQQGQVKDSISGTGLADVTVTIAGCTTKTDANGYYTLNNIVVTDEAVVNFEKEGYPLGSTKIQITETSGDGTISTNYLEYTMYAYSGEWTNGRVWTYESQSGATGGAVLIPAGTIHTDTVGNIYNGIVYSRWTFKDTMSTEVRDTFPGSFEGENSNGIIVPFVSYAITSVELKDENNVSLSLSDNITLVLPSVTGTTANTIPLWYYDYDQGLWIEEGYAQRQADGTYRGEISHPGTWSLSQTVEEEVGIYRGHIVDVDGSPVSDARVYAIGDNWISSDLTTDENGLFEIEVIPGNSFQLIAYNYKDKYEAKYNGSISAITSGEVVEDRI